MSMMGHHALLWEVAGGVVVVGGLLALTLTKKKQKTVDEITVEDMERIDSRLVNGDVARSESRFRRRYGVEARPKDFPKPRPVPTAPAESPTKTENKVSEDPEL